MESIFGRINKPFTELKELLEAWAEESDQMLVYEHTQDDGCKTVHCHIIAINITRRKKLYDRANWKALQLHGSAQFGFDKFKEGQDTIAYMSKGIFDPKMNKGFAESLISEQKKLGYVKKDKKVSKREVHWDVIEAIQKKAQVHNVIGKDQFGYAEITPSYNFDNIYALLMKELNDRKIRTSDHDLNRWLTTLLRNDYSAGRQIKENLRKKYFPDA